MSQIIRKIRNYLFSMVLLFSVPLILFYSSLSLAGKRFLTINEWVQFTKILLAAGIIHLDENGGPRAWAIIREGLSHDAKAQVVLKFQGETYQIPLPPYTIRKSCDRLVAGLPKGFNGKGPGPTIPQSCLSGEEFPTEFSSFITTASADQMNHYIYQTLPKAGWMADDRIGSVWVFRRKNTRLLMNLGSYLTVFIADFNLSLSPISQKP